jgi:hypothetical protein
MWHTTRGPRRPAVLAALIASWVAIGGCASAARDDAEGRATLECMNIARETRMTPQGPRTVVDQDRYQQCLKERGAPPR